MRSCVMPPALSPAPGAKAAMYTKPATFGALPATLMTAPP